MIDQERIAREKEFHDERFGGDDGDRGAARKYYAVSDEARTFFNDSISRMTKKSVILEYGCAMGDNLATTWIEDGCDVFGIDISSAAIKQANNRFAGTKYAPKATYLEMNAEDMTFGNKKFGLIVGSGIIHHLDLKRSFSEIARVLKPTGSAIFIEPMGHNPIINLYRKLTPKMRTEDEHPLTAKDIEMMKKYFGKVDVKYFNLFSLLAVPFRNTPMFNTILSGLKTVDRVVFKIPFLRNYAWNVVVTLGEPKQT